MEANSVYLLTPYLQGNLNKLKFSLFKILKTMEFTSVLNTDKEINIFHCIELVLYYLNEFNFSSEIFFSLTSLLKNSAEVIKEDLEILLSFTNEYLTMLNFPYILDIKYQEYDYIYFSYYFILEMGFLEDFSTLVNDYFKYEIKIKTDNFLITMYEWLNKSNLETYFEKFNSEDLKIISLYKKNENNTKEFKFYVDMLVKQLVQMLQLKEQDTDITKNLPLHEIISFSCKDFFKFWQEKNFIKEKKLENMIKKLNIVLDIINSHHQIIEEIFHKLSCGLSFNPQLTKKIKNYKKNKVLTDEDVNLSLFSYSPSVSFLVKKHYSLQIDKMINQKFTEAMINLKLEMTEKLKNKNYDEEKFKLIGQNIENLMLGFIEASKYFELNEKPSNYFSDAESKYSSVFSSKIFSEENEFYYNDIIKNNKDLFNSVFSMCSDNGFIISNNLVDK